MAGLHYKVYKTSQSATILIVANLQSHHVFDKIYISTTRNVSRLMAFESLSGGLAHLDAEAETFPTLILKF
ncbi:uncharacterized protein PADG_12082 [Paracoccidioides brasiliensis Pb18]|uniref:Uncharacterized protein n=1 Tax=Paracoccidioides brasiliensis (strain Pb18) TaxID=502780 RepID=A0A0A0HWL2_PARBD|nr:uncharacterized protein PADG_12082 [Paracoccidioides brasiliensis Pb18]KGM91775.1 hypothetical protein PADG_12082 [Paracoccidioides brasiliensis Pb18]